MKVNKMTKNISTLLILMTCVCFVSGQQGRCTPTKSDQLGPKWVPESPWTTILAPESEMSDPDKKATIQGRVLNRNCQPLSGVKVDLWYAGGQSRDGDAIYTDRPAKLWYRGHTFTTDNGKFQFKGTYPGIYNARPIRHYHVKIDDGNKEFITQFYFRDDVPRGFANYVKVYGMFPQVTRSSVGCRIITADIVVAWK